MAPNRPPLHAHHGTRVAKLEDRVAERKGEQAHAGQAHGVADKARPGGRVERAPQVCVQRLLNNDADSRRDCEESRKKSAEHRGYAFQGG
jgi:hypothetical protein